MIALCEGVKKTSLPINSIQMIPTTDRSAIDEMLKMTKYIDVIIPRGGTRLIEYISSRTCMPLFKHLSGICHTYIHQEADREMARKIVLNAKMRRMGICGATEVLLVDKAIMVTRLPAIIDDLNKAGCKIRADNEVVKLNSQITYAGDCDYDNEFLDAIIAVKIIADISEAINRIERHGAQHTDAIITENQMTAKRFLKEVDSAIVMHNTSTQFADGGEFGMGAEIGIATGKLHARGPIGIEQLTTFKYLVHGDGQIRV
jgi:glutamate-5-semialdehyde dehydrogenase